MTMFHKFLLSLVAAALFAQSIASLAAPSAGGTVAAASVTDTASAT